MAKILSPWSVSDLNLGPWDHLRRWSPAAKTAELCAKCGRAIAADEPIWMIRAWGKYANPARSPSICRGCVDGYEYSDERVGNCESCGREVHRWLLSLAQHVTCCQRCEARANNARASFRRAEKRHDTICTVCGGTFTPGKSNAATCSSACRQKAYRIRLRGAS